MPEICRFFGIIISMYYHDHGPPHFHARYGGQKAIISLDDLSVLDGGLGPRAMGLVREWAGLHRNELVEDWERARAMQTLKLIPPLE